jgi:outer membrane protein OmpA-like peptidoglycan-associated protein
VRFRWRSEAAAGVALLALAAAPASGQEAASPGVLDLTLPVQDLSLNTARLDNSVSTLESDRRVELTLAADVLFRFDRATLSGRAESRIGEAVGKIRATHPRDVRVTGYTDAKGTPAYNVGLSRRRAEAVARALRSALGADAPPIRTRGRGEAHPIAPNVRPDGSDNPRGRARNRRVTIAFPRG